MGAAISTTYAIALAVLDLPGKFPWPLNNIMFIGLILGVWGSIYAVFKLLSVDLNLWGVPLDGYSVAMVVVAGMCINHFLFGD